MQRRRPGDGLTVHERAAGRAQVLQHDHAGLAPDHRVGAAHVRIVQLQGGALAPSDDLLPFADHQRLTLE